MKSAQIPKYQQYRQDLKECRSQLKQLYQQKQSKLMRALYYLNDQQKTASPQVNGFLLQQRQNQESNADKYEPKTLAQTKIGKYVDSISKRVIEERRMYRQKIKNKQIQISNQNRKKNFVSSPLRNDEQISSHNYQSNKPFLNFIKSNTQQSSKANYQYGDRLRKIQNYHEQELMQNISIQPITALNHVYSNQSLSVGNQQTSSPVFGKRAEDEKYHRYRITEQNQYDGKATGYYTITDSEDEKNKLLQEQRQMQKIRQINKKSMKPIINAYPSINKFIKSEAKNEYIDSDPQQSIINKVKSNKMLLKPNYHNETPTRQKINKQPIKIANMHSTSQVIEFKKKNHRSQYEDFIQKQHNKLKQQSIKYKFLGDEIYAVLQGQNQYGHQKTPQNDKFKSYQQLQLSNSSMKKYQMNDNGNHYRIQPFLQQNYNFEEGFKNMMAEIIDLFAISELIRYHLRFKTFEVLNKIYSYSQLKFCSSTAEHDEKKQKISISLFTMLLTRMLPRYKKSQLNTITRILFQDKQQLNFEQFGQSLRTKLSDNVAQQLTNAIVNLTTARTEELIKKLFTTWIQIDYLQHRLRTLLKSQPQKMQQFTELVTEDGNISIQLFVQYLSTDNTSNIKQRKIKIQLYLGKILKNEYTEMSWLKWIYTSDE